MKTFTHNYTDALSLQNFVKTGDFIAHLHHQKSLLVQVFTGVIEKSHCEILIKDILEIAPHAQIIGCTTAGEINDGKVSTGNTVISFSFFEDTLVKTFLALRQDNEKENSEDFGKRLAQNLKTHNTKAYIVFGNFIGTDIPAMLAGINQVAEDVMITGGNAGDNFQFKQCFVFTEKGVSDSGAVGASLNSDVLAVKRDYHLSWQPIGKKMVVTKMQNPTTIAEIDGKTPLDVYKHYFGDIVAENFHINVNTFPLLLNRDNIWLARVPITYLPDGALVFNADIKEGEEIQFGFGNVQAILATNNQLLERISQTFHESIFIYSCAIRRAFMQEATELEVTPFSQIAKNAGFFTYGEYYYNKVQCKTELANATITFLCLTENEKSAKNFEPNQISTSGKETEYTNTLYMFTNLVNAVTSELDETNKSLEEKNQVIIESLEEVNQTNEELFAINESLENSKLLIEAQKQEIELKNTQVTESINYARNIQNAIMVEQETIVANFKGAFVSYLPKDIVSGDFYWFVKVDNLKIIILADCTGHGVAGAFMTMIGVTLLNEIIHINHIKDPKMILENMDTALKKTFQRHQKIKDGMDMAVVVIDETNKKLTFAGAKQNLYIIRNKQITQIKGANNSIDGILSLQHPFFNHIHQLKENDIFYLSSDGYRDQFGGQNQSKYLHSNFKSLLLRIHELPFNVQKTILETEYQRWKGNQEQTDDVLVMGFQVS